MIASLVIVKFGASFKSSRATRAFKVPSRLDDDDKLLVPPSPGIDVIARSVITRVCAVDTRVIRERDTLLCILGHFFLRSCVLDRA